jgi:glutathione S-transferase
VWGSIVRGLDSNVAIEVFPQQPPDRIAFRAVLRMMNLFVEGALGQAIDVFWKSPERLSAFTFDGWTGQTDCSKNSEEFLAVFEKHLPDCYARMQSLRDYLGAEWISIEGYAGPSPEASLFVADVDLPLDSALLQTSFPEA